jgi:hypothetical protein
MAHMGFQMPGMPPPQMHQPPQIFGMYGPDGLPQMQHLPPDLAAQMFPDAHLYADDPHDAKKRRIARVSNNKMCTLSGADCQHRLFRYSRERASALYDSH